jgi:ATP-binding cassette subfamily G (WHITE) protein 2 (SNQ2)
LRADGRPIHYKHANARFYQAPAFLFGRLFSTLPQRAIEMMAFGVPTYFLVGLDRTAKSFFVYFGIILAYTFGLKMMYSIIAHLLPNKQNVLSLGTFFVLVLSLFSGFIVFPNAIPGYYYNWIYFANPMAWAFRGLVISEFTSGKYDHLNYDEFGFWPGHWHCLPQQQRAFSQIELGWATHLLF